MKGSQKKQPTIDPTEWNFDPVPEDELPICLAYEYARELTKSSQAYSELIARSKEIQRGYYPKQGIEISSPIQWLIHREKFPLVCVEDFSAPPWQKLNKDLRKTESFEFNDWTRPKRQSDCLNIFLEREWIEEEVRQRDMPPQEKLPSKSDFKVWASHHQGFDSSPEQSEQGFIGINWNYPDTDLLAEFKRWLKEKRGDRKATASERGRIKMRSQLKALGAKRISDAGFTVPAGIEHTRKNSKDRIALYGTEEGWFYAKTTIVPAVLKLLFPHVK